MNKGITTAGRGIDHLVLAVNSLVRARATYERLGFKVTPDAQHSWGTANCLVQVDGSFLEILTVDRPELLFEADGNAFAFGAFNRDFLKKREGFSMLVLESLDAAEDLNQYIKAGIHAYDPFGFSRIAKLPDGGEAEVSFSIAATRDPLAPDAGFFTCQQHAPEYFWKAEYQDHPNTALRVAEVGFVSVDPNAHKRFFEGFTGVEAQSSEDGGLKFETPRGIVSVETPEKSTKTWGKLPDNADLPAFAGFRMTVKSMESARDQLINNGISFEDRHDSLYVAPEDVFGTALILSAD